MHSNDMTIIICTKNSEKGIYSTLASCRDYPVILVDCSTDNTRNIAVDFKNVQIVRDEGNGLAAARNKGLRFVKTKYVMFLGSDNEIINDISYALEDMEYYSAVGFKTFIRQNTYFDRCMLKRWKRKFKIGVTKLLGTPYIFRTSLLKEYMYDDKMTHSDDTDLFKRLADDGHIFYRCNIPVMDISENKMENIKERFNRYGISDREYARKYNKNIFNILYAFKAEWIGLDLAYLPFYFILVYWRLHGRFKG